MLKSFILASLLVCTNGAAFACGPWYYSASDNRLYRIVPPLWKAPLSDDFTTKNIILWSRQTHFRDTAAIRRAVYTEWDKFVNWEELLWEMQNSAAAPYNPLSADNKFCAHLVERQDTDAVRLLYWSKMYSNIRTSQRSPWYYNSRIETDETKQLREMYEVVQKYKPAKKYADRYTFLAIKCLWALGEDSSTVALWEREKKHLKNSIFYKEAGDYAARSLTRMGRMAEADAIYRHNKNIVELMPAGIKLPEHLRIMLRVCPNSPQLIPILQDFLSEIDQEQARTYRWYDDETNPKQRKFYLLHVRQLRIPKSRARRCGDIPQPAFLTIWGNLRRLYLSWMEQRTVMAKPSFGTLCAYSPSIYAPRPIPSTTLLCNIPQMRCNGLMEKCNVNGGNCRIACKMPSNKYIVGVGIET